MFWLQKPLLLKLLLGERGRELEGGIIFSKNRRKQTVEITDILWGGSLGFLVYGILNQGIIQSVQPDRHKSLEMEPGHNGIPLRVDGERMLLLLSMYFSVASRRVMAVASLLISL